VRAALAGAREEGADTSEILLTEYRIEYCRDCRACMRTGRCVIADDFHKVRDALSSADGIILGSPTYGAAMNARMKNLFDRLGQFAFLTSLLGGKYVAGIATAGSFGAKKVARGLAASVQHSVFRRAYVSGALGVHLKGRQISDVPSALEAANALGRKMAGDYLAKWTYPLQNLMTRISNALIMRPLIRKGIQANRETMGGVYNELVRTGIIASA
jgi:multimeric flavodoxin WrbA